MEINENSLSNTHIIDHKRFSVPIQPIMLDSENESISVTVSKNFEDEIGTKKATKSRIMQNDDSDMIIDKSIRITARIKNETMNINKASIRDQFQLRKTANTMNKPNQDLDDIYNSRVKCNDMIELNFYPDSESLSDIDSIENVQNNNVNSIRHHYTVNRDLQIRFK